MKQWIYALTLFLYCCNSNPDVNTILGEAQGTTYQISYLHKEKLNIQDEVDSLLKAVDQSLSTYVPTSIISRMNQNDTTVVADRYFIEVFNKSIEVSQLTGGLFDVTVAPIINAWGFGFTKRATMDSSRVNRLLSLVGFQHVQLVNDKLKKSQPGIMIDFNAIAQGYTVDMLAELLEREGVSNYMVELGGEVRARGRNNKGEWWRIGIDKPDENITQGRPLEAILSLDDKAMATSGNYRKFYVENGRKYAHIIDPHTGYPAKHNLLSATVVAEDCITADAYATAFMVMGMQKALAFIREHPELSLQVFFIYDNHGKYATYASENLAKNIKLVESN